MQLLFRNALLFIVGFVTLVRCQDLVQEEQTDNAVKINWQPVWDSDPKPGDPKDIKPTDSLKGDWNTMLPTFPVGLQPQLGPCDAPNGLGLRNLFTQAQALLPHEQIRSIVRGAANDTEVQALTQLLNSPVYRERVANLSRTREYKGLRDFACYKMNFNLKLYRDFIKNLLQLSELSEPRKSGTDAYKPQRPGLRGLLQNIRDILPQQTLRELYERLQLSDWYLMRAIRTAQSYEFEAIVKLLRQNSDYRYLRGALSEVGLPLDELRELIKIALGWRP